jgi:nitrate reductase NapE component
MYMRAATEKSEIVRVAVLTISSWPLRSVAVMTV